MLESVYDTDEPLTGEMLVEHDKYEDLVRAAQEEAAATYSTPIPALIYRQAGRQFIVTSFPIPLLVDRVKLDTMKKGDDPDEHINRPLMLDHVRSIAEYLTTQPEYILPGITLSIQQPLKCHVLKGSYSVKLGQVILPLGIRFDVTDGQHRIKALEQALRTNRQLAEDGIAVTIVPEVEIDKIHQDFVDCAQVKPIPAALLTVFNQRDPLARLARYIVDSVPVFNGRIEKAGKTVGKNSINLFTMNQIRAGVAEMLTGDSMVGGPQLKRAVEERLHDEPSINYHHQSVLRFYLQYTEANPQWKKLSTLKADPARDKIDASELRQKFVHFTATGLQIIGRVGYSIMKFDEGDQSDYITGLGAINWSRNNPLWDGNVVQTSGKIVTQRAPVEIAIAKVKQELGLPLTERDAKRLYQDKEGLVRDEVEEQLPF